MGITFALRGDSLVARYSANGATPGLLGTTDRAAVTTDVVGINGVNTIDMMGSGAGVRQVVYPGMLNTPSGLNRSMLIRCKLGSAAALALLNMGVMTRNPSNYLGISATAGGEVNYVVGNESGAVGTGTSTGAALGTTAFHDIGISWDGTTGAGGIIIAVDGVVKLTGTASRDLFAPFTIDDQMACANIMLGGNFTQFNSHMSIDEVIIWDEIIDFTAAQNLTTGTGVLNGASRSYYLDVAAYDGILAAQGGGGSAAGFGHFGL